MYCGTPILRRQFNDIPDLTINLLCCVPAKVTVNYMEQNPDLTIFGFKSQFGFTRLA